MSNEWCGRLVGAAAQLPDRDVAALAAALDGGDRGLAHFRVRASSPVVRKACDTVLAAANATSASFAAGVLHGALQTRRRTRSALDVVWTGPTSRVTTSRLTSAAIVDLVDAAVSEVLLISYAMHQEPMLAGALSRADERGVSITLVAEREADNPGFHGPSATFPQRARASAAMARGSTYHWRVIACQGHCRRSSGCPRRQRQCHQQRDGTQP